MRTFKNYEYKVKIMVDQHQMNSATVSGNAEWNSNQADSAKPAAGPLASVRYTTILLLGVYFGVVLTKAEAVRWQRIHDMFRLQDSHLYYVILTAIVVAMVALQLLKRFRVKTLDGSEISYKPKPYHTGVLLGGLLFGAGWAITGACPGPVYIQLGAGEWWAAITLFGAFLGMYCYALLKSRLPH
ncbi:MAG: YeeE/YedE family protein [Planctomycetales bacterium]|nr:YeeE/YedE family protein [Planctomycetales bacterium]